MIAEICKGKEWTAVVSGRLHGDDNRQALGLSYQEKMSESQLQLFRHTSLNGSWKAIALFPGLQT